jgi:hypothetical protein
MFQNLAPTLCHRATAAAAPSETELLSGCGIAAGLRAAPAIPNGRSPRTGLAYRAAAQSRALTPGNIPSKKTEGIQS